MMDNADNSTAREPVENKVLKTDDLNTGNAVQSGNTCVDAVVDRKPVIASAANSDIKPVEELSTFVKSEPDGNATVQLNNDAAVKSFDEPKHSAPATSVKLEEPLATKCTDGNQVGGENAHSVHPKTEVKLEASMDEDDGEDLPDNFFDDFSNNDFMAGLDIVDDWIDDGDGDKGQLVTEDPRDDREVREKAKPRQGSFHGEKRERGARERPRYDVRRDRHSRDRYLPTRPRDQDGGRYQRRSRDREYDRRSKNREYNRAKEQGKSRDREHAAKAPEKARRGDELGGEDAGDSRRDPEKTKRDIQRDKIRCAKDHEIRVFQEQLKVAETGLVPPGTELDVVLESEKKKEIEKKESEKREAQMHGGEERRKSAPRYKADKRSASRERRRSRDRRRSPEFRRKRREYSRYEKERSPSPRHRRRSRSLTKDEAFRRNDDLRLRIREKRRERYINELSPVSETKMSRSPSMGLSFVSNVSDRELWLRNRDRYRSRYGRSCSPISSNSLSDHGSPKRKRPRNSSFIEEMKRQLADERPPPFTVFPATGKPYPGAMHTVLDAPRPVPPPLHPFHPQLEVCAPFPPSQPMFPLPAMCPSPYAAAPMMLGHAHPASGMPMNVLVPQHQGGRMLLQHEQPRVQAQPAKAAPDKPTFRNDANLKCCVSDSEALTKLFEEQKISLSDFLSVSAKPIDVQTINVHKKIQVISKCQEVVKAISDGARLCGRFFPTAMAASSERPADGPMKWKSPLRKLNPVRFMFTTPCKRNTHEDSSKVTLNKLLTVCGFSMLPDSVPRHLLAPKAPSLAPSAAALPAQHRAPDLPPIVSQSAVTQCASASVQTDKFQCQICEIRGARKFSACGTQTSGADTAEAGTQVYQEDLRESCVTFTPRGILKNSVSSVQSISHMTPAQLLALQQETTPTPPPRNEAFAAARGATLDRFSATLRSPLDARPSFSSAAMGSAPFTDPGYPGRSASSSLGMPKTSGFLGSANNAPFVASFSSSLDKGPFGGRPFGVPTAGRNLGAPGDGFQSNPWASEAVGSRSADRFSNDSNDRYSPEQTFKESGNMGYMARSMSTVPGGRGMPARGSYAMPNRPFYG